MLMQIVTKEFVKGKKVLLRYDIDVALCSAQDKLVVGEDFKLKAGLPTLRLCLENASKVIIIGHLGRPDGRVVLEFSVKPIREWFKSQGYQGDLGSGKLTLLENLRFDSREETADLVYAKELASMGDCYINEAFSSYHQAASTTVLPTLLPHAAGLHFAQEVKALTGVRENPKKPFVVIMGGAKVKDKMPVINALAQKADAVLVGGKLAVEIREQNLTLPKNVMVGKLNEAGTDIAPETAESWSGLIKGAGMIVWNGPLGKFEDPGNAQSGKIARMVLDCRAEVVVGGGDTVSLLGSLGVLGEFKEKGFVSVGGGAMLRFLTNGTLPTIEALQ